MSLATDQNRLRTQYRDSANLNARIALHARFSTNPYRWHRWAFDQFQPLPGWRVLELGCGPGTLWLKNRDRLPGDWDITLSDFSEGMLEDARRNLAPIDRPFTFRQLDAQALSLPDAGVDAVIANHMLYHVPDRPKAFAEIRRVLKPGGRLYASTNGQDHLRELSELQVRFGLPDPLGAVAYEFSLENGADQLSPWFDPVALHHYEDALAVTEAEPLIDFVASMLGASDVYHARMPALREHIEAELAQHGAIRITKSTGLFIATRH
jgi:ubiquinone/menaquinone biosynthesis C-methylase UbiE